MKKYQFVYPAIFIKDEDDGSYQVFFPYLNIYTSGKNITETFLYAKDLLKVYFSYALKYEVDYNKPSKIEKLLENCKPHEIAMYVDTIVETDK